MFVIGGIAFILFGILIIKDPVYCRGYCVDLSEYNVLLGCMCMLFGVACIWSEMRKRLRNKKR